MTLKTKNLLWLIGFFALALSVVIAGILSGCEASVQLQSNPNPWAPKPYVVHLDVIVGKYDWNQCVNAGGTYIVGDTKQYGNAIVGCAFPPKESSDVRQSH